jgi:hypothetical protein
LLFVVKLQTRLFLLGIHSKSPRRRRSSSSS